MDIDVLGGCGTFMGGLIQIMRQCKHDVAAYDKAAYPPMCDQLAAIGVPITCGYQNYQAQTGRQVVVGNSISRHNPVMDKVMNQRLEYISGPEWLYDHVLKNKDVIAVAGTHGKTTTTALVSWILEVAGKQPGYLIGGSPENFTRSANIGAGENFVIEADEYDTAFWDKRPKFMHYRPTYAILNNIEFDHADIYPNLEAIIKQFRLFLYTIPSNGLVVYNAKNKILREMVPDSCSVNQVIFNHNKHWHYHAFDKLSSELNIYYQDMLFCQIKWHMLGEVNAENLLGAIALCSNLGIKAATIKKAVESFKGVKRRMIIHRTNLSDATILEDFAHHPTSIENTLNAAQELLQPGAKLHAIISLDTFTMRSGVHALKLQYLIKRQLSNNMRLTIQLIGDKELGWLYEHDIGQLYVYGKDAVSEMVIECVQLSSAGDIILLMGTRNIVEILNKVVA